MKEMQGYHHKAQVEGYTRRKQKTPQVRIIHCMRLLVLFAQPGQTIPDVIFVDDDGGHSANEIMLVTSQFDCGFCG